MLDRKTAPSHSEINFFNLPSPEIHLLDSGAKVFVLRGVAQRIIKIELVFSAGKWFEPKKGVSHFTSQMLDKGTTQRNSFEIADFFDRHGASVDISLGFDFVSASLSSLAKNLNYVLPVFIELITSSVFPEDELMLQKEIFNQNLRINNEKIGYVANKVIRQHLFGNSHPYGAAIDENDVINLSRSDLMDFYRNYYSLAGIFVVGSIDESILTFLKKELSTIPLNINNKQAPVFIPSENVLPEYIEKVNSVQSSIRIGKRTINKGHSDYPELILLNHIFGGYFGSRLMKNIREEKGLTYGIHSSINNLKHDSFFVIAADVNRSNKEIAINEIMNEFKRLSTEPIGTNELQTAKNHLLGSLQLEVANPFSVIEKIKAIQLYELKEDYYNDLFLNILNLNGNALQKAANKYLNGNTIEIAVG